MDFSDDDDDGLDLEKLFASDDVGNDERFINTVDPTCWDCEKKITHKDDCFPQGSWGSFEEVLFRCGECWPKHMSDLKVQTHKEQAERKKIHADLAAKAKQTKKATQKKPKAKAKPKQTKKATQKKPKAKPKQTKKARAKRTKPMQTAKTGKKPTDTEVTATYRTYPKDEQGRRTKTRTADPIPEFKLNANVVGLWTDGQRYPAQIFGVNKKKYDLYFPQDGEVLLAVDEKNLAYPHEQSLWATVTRDKFVSMGNFDHKKHVKGTPRKFGRFKVESMGEGDNVNKYMCSCVSKRTDKNTYYFDMGYIQSIFLHEMYPFNDKGIRLDKDALYS